LKLIIFFEATHFCSPATLPHMGIDPCSFEQGFFFCSLFGFLRTFGMGEILPAVLLVYIRNVIERSANSPVHCIGSPQSHLPD